VKSKFSVEVIRKIVKCAVESHLRRTGKIAIEEIIGVEGGMEIKGKHDEKNCEKCVTSGKPCHLVRRNLNQFVPKRRRRRSERTQLLVKE